MSRDTEVDEQTPLLKKPDVVEPVLPPPEAAPRKSDDEAPLPFFQIFLLCLARLLEPIAFFALFTYAPQMIRDTGEVDRANVGYVSGAIESCFSVTGILAMPLWGRLSDQYGRKPVLVCSLAGVACSMTLFGFSVRIWQMFVFRCLAGMFSGSIVTIRTAIAELSTPQNQARAFSYFAFASNVGIFIGPLVGGILARPALQYPGLFGGFRLFIRFPYLLPSLFSGLLGASLALLIALFFKETLPPEAERKKAAEGIDTSMRAVLKIEGVLKVLLITWTYIFCGFAYTALSPLFESTEIELGGLGFSPLLISIFSCIGGAAQSVWLLWAFPYLERRWGAIKLLQVCCCGWPIQLFLVGPVLALVRQSSAPDWLFFSLMAFIHILTTSVAIGFSVIQIMANNISPSPIFLGVLNGLSAATMSSARVIAPITTNSIYAYGVGHGHAFLGWYIIIIFSLCQLPLARTIPAVADSKHKLTAKSDEEQQ